MKRYSGPNMAIMVADPNGYLVLAKDHDAEITRLREERDDLKLEIEEAHELLGGKGTLFAKIESVFYDCVDDKAEIARLRELVAGQDDGGHWYSQASMDAVVRERDEAMDAAQGMSNDLTAMGEKCDKYREALEAIVQHQSTIGGTLAGHGSVTLHIAQAALGEE